MSDMMCVTLKVSWCDIVRNVHAPTENETGSLHEELERVVDQFPEHHIKNSLRSYKCDVGRESLFKPAIANESLHEISNDNGIRVVNFDI
jgi:hypothetical protein